MKSFLRLLLVSILTLPFAHGVLAKTIKVRIQGEQGAAKEVAKSIASRLQATERYAVTDADAELYLHLSWMEGKEVTSVRGYICSFVFAYYPEKLSGIESCIGPYGLVTGRDVSSVAED